MRRRRSLVLGFLFGIGACGVVDADTSIRWLVEPGSLRDENGNAIAAGEATVLTFVSADAVIDLPDHLLASPLSTHYGDDVFYAAMPNLDYFGEPGSYSTNYMAKAGDSFVGMYAYAVILHLPYRDYTGLRHVPAGTRYGLTAICSVPLVNTAPGSGVPQSLDGGPVQTTHTVTAEPEPGRSARLDFDGDGKSDLGYYHPPTGIWHLWQSADGKWQTQFGFAGTIPIVGDFDGDGQIDFGCYHPPTGMWYLFMSTEGFWQTQFGFAGTIPIVGDFDGDGIDDFGCYHPPTGMWYVFKSTEGFWQTQFGYEGTIPIVGDFDGDGIDDFGCYHPPSGNWYVFKSTEGFWQTQFGYGGTLPIVGDFDGDGRDDFGCYHPPSGNWYLFQSTEGFRQQEFGHAGTLPLGGPAVVP